MAVTKRPLFDPPIVKRAAQDCVREAGAGAHGPESGHVRGARGQRVHDLRAASGRRSGRAGSRLHLPARLWLWFTVLFANFAEAMAEGRGKAQADELRKTRRQTQAKR